MLTILIRCCIILFLYFLLYLSFGSFLVYRNKDCSCISFAIIIGFLVYFGCFQLICLPFTILHQKLSTLSIIWLIICSIIIIVATIIYGKRWFADFKNAILRLRKCNPYIITAILVVMLQLIFIVVSEYTEMDYMYYVGDVTTSVYTNSLSAYSPYTGLKLDVLSSRYLLSTYPMNDGIFSQVFNIHPLIIIRNITPMVVIFISNLLYYKIGKILFKNDTTKACVMLIIAFIINAFNYTIFTSSTFLFLRTYEGKAILPNILLPMVFLVFIQMLNNYKNKYNWIYLFCIAYCSCSITMSAMLIIPVAIVAFVFPVIIMKKDIKGLFKLTICLIPCFFVFIYYILSSKGIIIFPA